MEFHKYIANCKGEKMKRLFGLILMIVAFAIGADVKPLVYDNIAKDSATQQEQYDYMLQYKLFGYEYLMIGQNDTIPDKSGWNGSSKKIEMKHAVVLGGPILTPNTIDVGNGNQFTTGPVRGSSFTMGNDNSSIFAGNWCFDNALDNQVQNIITRSNGKISCDSVPDAPNDLQMPKVTFPDTTKINIVVNDREKKFIDIPDVPSYDLYVNSIKTGTEDTLYFRMANRGTLTRIFVKDAIELGNHTVLQTYYGDSAISQDKYRGNLLFYTQKDFTLANSDNGQGKLQGTFISTSKIYFKSNIQFSGQLIANQLEVGDNFSGKNFHFVKFDPDTINVKLDKYGGLRENDSLVTIPIELSDTASVAVFFTYCFDLKDGVTLDDFKQPPELPTCDKKSVEVAIPRGSKVPDVPIQVIVKVDTLTEPNEYLVVRIDSINGAILPNGETSGELKIKIIDAQTQHVTFDTTAIYKFEENKVGVVDVIKVLNSTETTRFYLDSSWTDRYELDSITGELSLVKYPLDYEASTVDMIKVTLKDTGNVEVSRFIPIGVIDVNEAPTLEDATFTLYENTPVPSIVGTLKATDPDKNTKFTQNLYKIMEGDTTKFAIDPASGRITSTKIFNYEKDTIEYKLKVMVYDKDKSTELYDTAFVTIKIGNVKESPKFATNDTTFTIQENTPPSVIDSVKAYDDDGDKITYSIVEKNVPFVIDSNGVISSTREFDYEKEKQFVINVKATDGENEATIKVVIKIGNENEPVHINDTTLTVKENYTGPIGKVEGKDDDGEPVKYSVRDSNDYSIDSLGNIRIIKPLDYETQKTDTLVVYVSTLNPKDSIDYDTAIVVINVVNVNEPPKLQPNDTLSVPENCKNCEVGKVVAIDPDKDPITYTIKEPGFTIDTNGVIKVTNPLDYEKTPVVTITVVAKDTSGASDTATYKIKVTDVNEPVHTKDTTCSVKENYTGNVCKIIGTDEDNTKPTFIVTDTTNYKIDSTGQLVIIKPIDYEKKTKDTVKVIVTDGTFYDTATVIINVIDEDDIPKITSIDDKPPVDTIKTNDPDHKIEYKICENTKCEYDTIPAKIHKDTTIKVCNVKKTKCDSVVILFNDAPPVVILSNAKSTDAYIDYITIEEIKDDKIYVNKKDNKITVTVKDTVHKTETKFNIDVKLDTIPTKDIKIKEYNYLIDETKATQKAIGNNLIEVSEVIKTEDGNKIVVTKVIDKKGKDVDTVQTVTYTKKVNGKEVVITYKIDNLTGQRIGDYDVSYMIDSCTKVSYKVNDKEEIVTNKEGNIGYTITYDYTDEYGNKATASVDIVYDDIAPKVEILSPTKGEHFNTNAIKVKWTINGETQDTLNLQRLEKGVNYVIRRYVDKAGNVSADTVYVIMNEAKDIDITIINPVTEIDQDKVDEYYDNGNKYDPKNPYKVTTVDPREDKLPETIGVGLLVDIALPSVNATGGLATLDDIVKNGQIPVDDKGNIVGASTKGIPVEQYVEEHCTDEFKKDYKKNGLNIPLYDVTYNLHLWIYTNNANYVSDYNVEYTLNDQDKVTDAGTVQLVIDWLTDKDGNVKAKNGHALGTGAYITKLYSKSVAKHRCDYKEQKKGDKTVKKEENMKTFGYKRPKK